MALHVLRLRLSHKIQLLASLLILQASSAEAQGWNGRHGDGNGDSWWFGGGNYGNGNGNNGVDQSGSSFEFLSSSSYQTYSKALIAHAVIACLVWAFLIPLGGILLRLNIQSPWILRIHAVLQVTSYLAYIAAVGLGIYLVQTFAFPGYSMWNDSHTQLGLAILVLAFFQPILGYIHHKIFKRRAVAAQTGGSGKAPGRTVPGYWHLWLGRLLIVLGIINGGLGIRLAGQTPYQSSSTTRKAALGYGIGAGVMFLLYLVVVVLFEVRRKRTNRQNDGQRTSRNGMAMQDVGNEVGQTPPTYFESQESLRKEGDHLPAYQQHGLSTRYT